MSYKVRIWGPPGTGKTTYLLDRVGEELKSGVTPGEIVYTSFTKAAAVEAKERAIQQFQREYNPNEFTNFSTIHSICFKLLELTRDDVFAGRKLKEFGESFGYEVSDDSSDSGLGNEDELHDKVLKTDADYFEHFLNWQRNALLTIEQAYDKFIDHNDVPEGFNMELLRLYIKRRTDYKMSNNLWDFGDMLEQVVYQEIIPENVKVIIQDECQDWTPLLARIAGMWAEKAERVYMAADPYQCIYEWMSADPSIIINTKVDKTMVLKQSYRCPVLVHDLSREIVDRFSSRYDDDDYLPRQEQGHIVRTVHNQIEWNNLGDRVFYVHRTRWLLNKKIAELMRDGIPFSTLRGIKSPLQTEKAKVVNSLLRMVDNKSVTIADVVKVMDYLPSKTTTGEYLLSGSKAGAKRLAQEKSIRAISPRELHSLGFTDLFFRFFDRQNILEPIKMTVEEKSYFNRLVEVNGQQVLEKEPSLILSTIHGVKGKECDTLILNLDLTRKTYAALLDNPDQEHRLFYVGVTRSKNNVIILEPEDMQSYRL